MIPMQYALRRRMMINASKGLSISELPLGTLIRIADSDGGNGAANYEIADINNLVPGGVVLVRKNIHSKSEFNSGDATYYPDSTLNNKMTSIYNSLPKKLQSKIMDATFALLSSSSITRKVFALTYTMAGFGENHGTAEGKALQLYTSNENRIKKYNGSADSWWLSSPRAPYAYLITTDGAASYHGQSNSHGVVPAFVIPSKTPYDPTPNTDGSYNLILCGAGSVNIAKLKPTSGKSYVNGVSGLSAAQLHEFAHLISDNADITKSTMTVYVDCDGEYRKVDIGNQITISLQGTNYVFDVIGFNHDDLTSAVAYGSITATGKAGFTFQMHDLFATTYVMNRSNTNSGGWKSSAMRTSTMATMKGYLPDDWEAIIKPVNKASGTGGGSSSGTETVSDSCFLLAEIEIFGSTSHSVSGEGTQYAYYKAGNSKVKNKSGSANNWWERSPYSGNSGPFCRVSRNGNANYLGADASFGVAFGFCV